MNTPHKNAEVIKAWADGKEIQYRFEDGKWHDFEHCGTAGPWISDSPQWRIKPQKRELWLNVRADGKAFDHPSREEADRCAGPAVRIACIRIEFEEGEGL